MELIAVLGDVLANRVSGFGGVGIYQIEIDAVRIFAIESIQLRRVAVGYGAIRAHENKDGGLGTGQVNGITRKINADEQSKDSRKHRSKTFPNLPRNRSRLQTIGLHNSRSFPDR